MNICPIDNTHTDVKTDVKTEQCPLVVPQEVLVIMPSINYTSPVPAAGVACCHLFEARACISYNSFNRPDHKC